MINQKNLQAAQEHEQRRLAALSKIRLLRRAQKEQQELNHKEKVYGNVIPE